MLRLRFVPQPRLCRVAIKAENTIAMTDHPSLHPFPKFVVPNPSLTNSSRTQLPQVPTYLLDAILTTSVHQRARPSRSHRHGHHGHRTKIAMAALSLLHFSELFFMILLRYDALVSPAKQVSWRTFVVIGRPLPPSLRTDAPPYMWPGFLEPSLP